MTQQEIDTLLQERDRLRKAHRYAEADAIRLRVERAGYRILDGRFGSYARPKPYEIKRP